MFYELSSSHPLPAKRIRALERQAEAMGRPTGTTFREEQPESFWDEFLVDLLFSWLPAAGFLAGGGLGLFLFAAGLPLAGLGALLLLWGLGLLIQRRFAYPPLPETPLCVKDLVGEVKVSGIRTIPGMLEGKIIGRGVPGLFYSEDLVLQDSTGFIVLDYRQPLGFLEFLFGLLKAERLIGQSGRAQGWFRRAPRPFFEMRRIVLEGGEQVVSYSYPVAQFLVYALCSLGGLALLLQLLLPAGIV
jgi:heat shock protein HtpX